MIIYTVAKTVTNECQNLLEQFPHLITDLATVCFEDFQKTNTDETLTLLVYEARYFDTLQVDASTSASAVSLYDVAQPTRGVIKRIVTLDPQRPRLEFTGWHYALVARHFIDRYLEAYSR